MDEQTADFRPRVAYDESGHSGSNLLRENEPFLVLGSVSVNDSHIAEVENLFGPMQASEWKFKNFKGRERYLQKFGELIQLPWMSDRTVQVFAIHKKYMVMTKMVDVLQEPFAKDFGIDLYDRGGALALANLLFTILPTYLGEPRFDNLLATFVDVVRSRSLKSLGQFCEACEESFDHLNHTLPEGCPEFSPFVLACRKPERWLPHLSPLELDPLIPSYFSVSEAWGRILKQPFLIIADESKTLVQEKDRLMQFADESLLPAEIQCPGGPVELPLKVADITMVCSSTSRPVQLADLISGGVNSWLTASSRGESLVPWQLTLREFFINNAAINGLLPSQNITPEHLGTENVKGTNPVDYSMRILAGDPSVRK